VKLTGQRKAIDSVRQTVAGRCALTIAILLSSNNGIVKATLIGCGRN